MLPRSRAYLLGLLGLLTPLAACDGSTAPATPAAVEIASGDGQEGSVATTLDDPLAVRVVNESGAGVSGVSVSWEVTGGEGSIAPRTDETGSDGRAEADWTLGPQTGAQTVTATVDGLAPVTFEAEAVAAAPAAMEAESDASPEGTVGEELDEAVSVVVSDAFGNPTPGVAVTWSVTEGDGAVDPAEATTDAEGRATTQWTLGTTAGSEHAVRAEVEGIDPVSFQAEAAPGPLAEIRITPEDPTVEAGGSVSLEVALEDQYGNAVPDRTVTWESGNEDVATVTSEGVVETSAPGPVEVEAHAEEQTGTTTVTVLAATSPLFSGIEPTLLTAGGTVTITGSGFSPVADWNRVRIDGVEAEVTAATETELQIAVPPSSAFPCRETRQVTLELTVPDHSNATLRSLSVAEQVGLAAGEARVLTDIDEARCTQLTRTRNDETYLFAVFNQSDSPTTTESFRVRGDAVGSGSTSPPAPAPLQVGGGTTGLAPAAPAAAARSGGEQRLGSARREVMERSRNLYERLVRSGARPGNVSGAPAGATRSPAAAGRSEVSAGDAASGRDAVSGADAAPGSDAAQARAEAPAAQDPPAEGDVLTLRIPEAQDLCEDYTEVDARVVYSGQRAVVLEDATSPLATQIDLRFEDIGEEFESTMFPILETYFGDPLAMDEALDGTGQVYMLFTPEVNDLPGITGFVSSGDFFDRADCAASNERAIFYAWVPETTSEVPDWYWEIRATVMKESKHVTSTAERMARDADELEATWLEESTGRIAEEFYAREVFGYGQGDNTTYSESIACERNCFEQPRVMFEHFGEFYSYLQSPQGLSILGPSVEGETTFSSSAWSFVRWAVDHYGGPEADFFRSLVQDPARTGIENLEARTGQDFGEMFGKWALSIVMDERAPEDPELAHPSWDLPDVFAGMNENLPGSFPAEFPLAGWALTYGEFDQSPFEVQGGTAAFFNLTGQAENHQLLEILAPGGGNAPSGLGMAIVRVQ